MDSKEQRKAVNRFSYLFLALCMVWMLLVNGLGAVTAAPKDRKAPTAPSSLMASAITETSVALTWKASTDQVGVTGYSVYRGTQLIGKTAALSYTVTALSPGTAYTFSVKAYDQAGNVSLSSNPLSVTTKAAVVPEQPAAQKALIGYYSGWSTYSGRQVADLDGSKLTHINYAFANIGADLRMTTGDSYADVEKRFPGDADGQAFYGNYNQLLKLKQKYPHLKTLISVGGWSWSEKFSDVALTDASRTAFADSAVAFIVKYGFDGVDIDWEYPVAGGEADNIKRPEDKQNFTLLMQKLREKLDAQGTKDGKRYLLSFAGASGTYYTNNVELSKLQQYVDFVNIMAYDFHGTWDTKTGLNAPLYKDPSSGFTWDSSVHDAVQLYLNSGVPASKLIMGVPFYGYRYDNVQGVNNGLYQSFSGGSSMTYAEIAASMGKGYTRHYHAASRVPYLYNGSSFITYDDPESIGQKAAYMKEQGIAGAMVWTLSQDSLNADLLTALSQGLQ